MRLTDTDWRCPICLRWWPVRVLVADCLAKHEAETKPTPGG